MSRAGRELPGAACFAGVLAVASFGCSDPPVVTSPSSSSSKTAALAASGAASAAAPVGSAGAVPKVEVQESEFSESERSRDPFRSFANSFNQDNKNDTGHHGGQRKVILKEYALDELKLIGIVTRAEPAKAMLVDPNGKGYVIQRGQFVGRADVVQAAGSSGTTYEINWRVERIRPGDVVLVREDPANPDVPSATRVIALRPEEQPNPKE